MLKRLIASHIGLLMFIDLRASTFSSFSLQHLPQNGNMSMCTERHTTDKITQRMNNGYCRRQE